MAMEAYRVRFVIDGDTIVLANNRHLRYIGIDAPEILHQEQTAEPYGYAAKRYNHKLIGDQIITIEYGMEAEDRYHRLLGYVFKKDRTFINQRMLQKGYAYYLYRKPNIQYHRTLLMAQQEAMLQKKGIWRRWKKEKLKVIGNKNSRRFHVLGCPYAKRIAASNRIMFNSRWEAFYAGYAPCRCNKKGVRK